MTKARVHSSEPTVRTCFTQPAAPSQPRAKLANHIGRTAANTRSIARALLNAGLPDTETAKFLAETRPRPDA